MSLQIRLAQEADLPAVLALYAQPGMDDERVLPLPEARRIWREFQRYPSYWLFVACEADGSVVGTYALLVMHNLAHLGTPSAIAEDVVVSAERQGQGIGRALMAHALQQARTAGAYKLALSSNSKRKQAHAFYQALGFQQHGLSFVIETPDMQTPIHTDPTPLLRVRNVAKRYGDRVALHSASFDLWPGEVLAVVGESGSGKTTLLNAIAARSRPDAGSVEFLGRDGQLQDIHAMSEAQQRLLARTEWGFVHQNPADGLRMDVSAGANVGERLMGLGERHYGRLRCQAEEWLQRVEIDAIRIDDAPRTFSGGMRQRLQIARNLVTRPRLVFMDEPTSGLDVSVQARLLDLLRGLTQQMQLAVVIVTHDLAVARLLAHRMAVMQRGAIVETGLTDQVLDDPQHPYTQLLVSSVLQP